MNIWVQSGKKDGQCYKTHIVINPNDPLTCFFQCHFQCPVIFLKAFSDIFPHWHTKKVSSVNMLSVKLCHPPASVLYLSKHNSLFTLYVVPSISTVSRFSHSFSSPLFQVLVWHTRTEKPHLANEPKHRKDTVVIEVWEEEPSSGSKNQKLIVAGHHLLAGTNDSTLLSLLIGLIQSVLDRYRLWGTAWFRTGCLSNVLCANWTECVRFTNWDDLDCSFPPSTARWWKKTKSINVKKICCWIEKCHVNH